MKRRTSAALLLALAALWLSGGLSGCRGGYETETLRGEGVREWFLQAGGARVEALAVWPANASGAVPALLFVHDDRGSAQSFRRAMFSLAREGYYTMSVSLPGFGDSTGPEDFGGPRSLKAVLQAVDYLAGQSEVRPWGLAVFGEGTGAVLALAAAALDERIRLAALEEGIYDLGEAFPRLPEGVRERVRRAVGGTPSEAAEGYRQRSAAAWLDRLRVPLLVIHSSRNRAAPLAQAEALVQRVRQAGQPAQLQIAEKQTDQLNPRRPSLNRWVLPFVKEHLPTEQPLKREPEDPPSRKKTPARGQVQPKPVR